MAARTDTQEQARAGSTIRTIIDQLNEIDARQTDPEIAAIRLAIENIDQVLQGTTKEIAQ